MYKQTLPSSVLCSSSYALGPMDTARVSSKMAHTSSWHHFHLLLPDDSSFPAALLDHPDGVEGLRWGYEIMEEGQSLTPIQVVNLVWNDFKNNLYQGGTYPFIVGMVLGELSALAEEDYLMALVGLHHLLFLLSLVPWRSGLDLFRSLNQAVPVHRQVLARYRARVRLLRDQGYDFYQAQRDALDAFACQADAPGEKEEVA